MHPFPAHNRVRHYELHPLAFGLQLLAHGLQGVHLGSLPMELLVLGCNQTAKFSDIALSRFQLEDTERGSW
jgi:hypothetical protein